MVTQINPAHRGVAQLVRIEAGRAHVYFGTGKPDASTSPENSEKVSLIELKRIKAEKERLAKAFPTVFGSQSFYKSLLGKTLTARASYNLDPMRVDALNPFLPVRSRLVRLNDGKALKQYDQLVAKILKIVEFQEVESVRQLRKKLNLISGFGDDSSGIKKLFKLMAVPFQILNRLIRSIFEKGYMARQLEKSLEKVRGKTNKIDDSELENVIRKNSRSITDPSSKYMIAAQIAELFYNRPEYAEAALGKRKIGNHERPLRVILTKDRSLLYGGHYLPGLNVILINQGELWTQSEGRPQTVAQHEFIHALSDHQGMEYLPDSIMNPAQRKTYDEAKEAILKIHKENDAGFIGFFRVLKNWGNPKTGIDGHAFRSKMEFLPVTLDAFKAKPETLCQTQPGIKLYSLYRDIFGIDPLKDSINEELGKEEKPSEFSRVG